MKKILILGANSYLAKKVLLELDKKEFLIICSTRREPDIFYNGVEYITSMIEDIYQAIDFYNVDTIINFICNYGREEKIYGDVLDANLNLPLKVLDYASLHNVNTFITIGTALPDNLNMYTFSKSIFNKFGNFYSNKTGISFYSLRLEMFYGYDEPRNRFIPDTITKMLKGEEVNTTLGVQKRDIISVDDVVSAIINILYYKGKKFLEIPIGTGIAPSISELVDFIWYKTGKKSIVNKGVIKTRKNEPDCVANNEVINEIMDWNPIYWQSGISNMIDMIKKEMENENFN